MILAGLAFKVSAAPFHMWTPDVYQGAPTSVTAFMSAATKTAALVVLLRVLVTAFPERERVWTIAVAVLAAISLVWGNLAALAQTRREAAARVLVDLARRLHADGGLGQLGARRAKRSSTTSSRTPRCPSAPSRSSPRASASFARAGDARVARGARLGAAVPRHRDVDVHARHGRLPAHGRHVRQALRLLGRVRGGRLVARPHRGRRHGGLARVLPERRPLDVHALRARSFASRPRAARLRATRRSEWPSQRPWPSRSARSSLVQPILDAARDAAASLPF